MAQKSGNYHFQRRLYNVHKGGPYLLMVTYTVSVCGPCLADGHNNDANITKCMLLTNAEGIQTSFHDNYIYRVFYVSTVVFVTLLIR